MRDKRTLFRFLPLAAALTLVPVATVAQTVPAPVVPSVACPVPALPQVLSACQQGAALVSDGHTLVVAPAGGTMDVIAILPWATSASDIVPVAQKATATVTAFDQASHQAHVTVALDNSVLHMVTLRPAAAAIAGASLPFAVLTAGGLTGALPPGGTPGILLPLPGAAGNQLYVRQFDPTAETITFDKPPGGNDKLWVTGTLGRTTALRAFVSIDPSHNQEPIALAMTMAQDGITVGADGAKLDVSLGPFGVTLANIAAKISQSSSFSATLSVKTPASFPLKLASLSTTFEPGGIPNVCPPSDLISAPAPIFASKDLGVGLTVTKAAFHCTPGVAPALDGLTLALSVAAGASTASYTALVSDHGIAFTDNSSGVTTPNALTLPIAGSVKLVGLDATVSSVLLTLPTLQAGSVPLLVTVNGSAKLPGLDNITIPDGKYTFAVATTRDPGAAAPRLRALCPRGATDPTKPLSVPIPKTTMFSALSVGPLTITAHCTDLGNVANETWSGIDGDALPIALAARQFTTSAPLSLPAFTFGPDGLRWRPAGAAPSECLDLYRILHKDGLGEKPTAKAPPCTTLTDALAVTAAVPTAATLADTAPTAGEIPKVDKLPANPDLQIFGFRAYVLDGTRAYYGCLPKAGVANNPCHHQGLAIALNAYASFSTRVDESMNSFSATERGWIVDLSDPKNVLGKPLITPNHFDVAGLAVQFADTPDAKVTCDPGFTAGINFDPAGDGVLACGRIVLPIFLQHEKPNLDPNLAVNASAVGVQMQMRNTALEVRKLRIGGAASGHAIDTHIESDGVLKCDTSGPGGLPKPGSGGSFGIFEFCLREKDGFTLQSTGDSLAVHLHGFLRVTKGLPTDNIAELDAAFNRDRFVAYATLTDFKARFGTNTVSVENIKIVSAPLVRSVAGDVVVQTAQFGDAQIYLQNVGMVQNRDSETAQWHSPRLIGKPDLKKTGISFGIKVIGDFFTAFAFHGFKFKGL